MVAGMIALANEGLCRFFEAPSIVQGMVERPQQEVKAMPPAGRRFVMFCPRFFKWPLLASQNNKRR